MSDRTLGNAGIVPGDGSLDPMGRFSGQASVSLAAGFAGLAVGGPVIGTLAAALGATAAAIYVHLIRRPQPARFTASSRR